MLNNVYTAVKDQLTTLEAINLVTRWNSQLQSGLIHTEPACFIDFPAQLNLETLNRQEQITDLVISVHLVGRIVRDQDGSVDDTLVASLENLATEVYDHLQGMGYDMADSRRLFNSMNRTGYQEDANTPGWIDIIQNFECILYQPTVTTRYTAMEKMPPEIEGEMESPIPD